MKIHYLPRLSCSKGAKSGFFDLADRLQLISLFTLAEVHMKHFFRLALVLTLTFVCALHLNAQTSSGTIAGAVTDSTGLTVNNATVVVKSSTTGESRTTTTTSTGSYRIDGLGPGIYTVTINAEGFAETTVPNISVSGSVITAVNATVQVGSAISVEVNTNAELLKTESGEMGTTIGVEEIRNLPISSQNPYALALTLPGVSSVTTADFTNGVSYSVNGSRPRANNYLIEGQDNNDTGITGQGLQPQALEALQEVTILTNSYSAEFGHGGGSVANLIYKSGTNTFHGSVYDRIFNSSLDATDHEDVLAGNPKAKSRENVYGYTIGGPVLRDRLFFFNSLQFDHYRTTANLGVLELPTAAGFAKLQQFSSNPRVANLLTAYGSLRGTNANTARTIQLGPDPVTGVDRGSVAFAGVQRSLGALTNASELVAKVDYRFDHADNIQFRFIRSPYSAPYDTFNFPSQLPGFDTTQKGTAYNAGITETHIFSSKLLNEFRASYGRIGFAFDLRPETYANPLALMPAVTISNIKGYGIPGAIPQGRFHNTYQLQDALSWTHGNHFLKVGVDISDVRVRDLVPFNYYGSIGYTQAAGNSYTALANYIDDFGGAAGTTLTQQFGNPTARPQIYSQNYYAQDTWKPLSNLSIEMGLRYEYNGAPFNYLAYPAFDSSNPTCFLTCHVPLNPDRSNVAPRLGFAFSPISGGKTVIRGGFGIFYDHLFTNIIDNVQASAPNAASPTVLSSVSGSPRGTAAWSTKFASLNHTPLATNTSNVVDNNLRSPRTLQWNLNIERQLPFRFLLTAAYVGARGEHLYATTEFNPTLNNTTGSTARLFTGRGRIIRQDTSGDSSYHSGQLELDRRFSHGFQMRAAYTWGKDLDDTSEIFTTGQFSTYAERQYPYYRGREYSASTFDHKHIFAVEYTYAFPKWHAQGMQKIPGAVVNGWSFAGITRLQSGNPINVEIGYDWNGDGISNDRPILATKSAPIATWAVDGNEWFGLPKGSLCDGTYFWYTDDNCHSVALSQVHWTVSPFGTTANTIGRNALYTPGFTNTDFSLQRSFHIVKEHSFDVRAEVFDIFNHANTGTPNYTLISGIFNGVDGKPATSGQQTFANYPLTISGGRNLRFFLRYAF
jgi:outer membrane receptor protein involved in Fe transport